MLIIVLLIQLLLVNESFGVSYPCPSPEFRDPSASIGSPIFPSIEYSSYPTTVLPIVQDHWSEMAKMFRPTKITPISNPTLTACPHLESNLRNFHDPTLWAGNKRKIFTTITNKILNNISRKIL
jgi:hypothetical protein